MVPEPSRPGRKRSESSRRAILNAALSLARDQGLQNVTMEGIATRAGVGKQTLYRWWNSKAALVLEALKEAATEDIAPPISSSLQEDLRTFLRATFRAIQGRQGTAPLLQGLMAQAQLVEGFREEFRDRFIDERRTALRKIFSRAQTRGELRPGFSLDLGVDLAFGVLWYRLLVGHHSLNPRLADQLAEAITLAARPRE